MRRVLHHDFQLTMNASLHSMALFGVYGTLQLESCLQPDQKTEPFVYGMLFNRSSHNNNNMLS